MRAALALLLAGCSADIPSMSYFCGPDRLCPNGQACDGETNTCVAAAEVTPYSCPAPIATMQLPALACVSALQTASSCLAASTAATFVFDVPAGCTSTAVNAVLSFPTAFAPLALTLTTDAEGTAVTPLSTTCTGATGAGDNRRCLTASVAAATRYDLRIAVDPTTADDCGGSCAFNRYDLTLQLGTP